MSIKEKLTINPETYAKTIEDFIRNQVAELDRDGIAMGLSGGVDSSTVGMLCVNAVGKENVTGVIISEKQGNPDAEKYAREFAGKIGVKIKKLDITKALKSLGVYKSLISHIPTRAVREAVAKKGTELIEKVMKKNPYDHSLSGAREKLFTVNKSNMTTKQRVRMVRLYRYADQNNLLVVGAAHKSEDFTGLYVKFGIDDAADVMPLKNLYRTQILQLAKYLGVPEDIMARTPNPDVIPGVTDKYMDLLKIPYDKVDMILCGLEMGLETDDIASQADVSKEDVERMRTIVKNSAHMRQPSRAPVFE